MSHTAKMTLYAFIRSVSITVPCIADLLLELDIMENVIQTTSFKKVEKKVWLVQLSTFVIGES